MIHERYRDNIIVRSNFQLQNNAQTSFSLLWNCLELIQRLSNCLTGRTRSKPFLDLTYPNMQIVEKRSRATSKIPGGEWTIQLARVLEEEYNLRLWVDCGKPKWTSKKDMRNPAGRVCACMYVRSDPLSVPINICRCYEKNKQSEK